MFELSSQELLLMPVLCVFLNALPKGAPLLDIVNILSTNGVKVSSHSLEKMMKRLPAIFTMENIGGIQRWRLTVFECFR